MDSITKNKKSTCMFPGCKKAARWRVQCTDEEEVEQIGPTYYSCGKHIFQVADCYGDDSPVEVTTPIDDRVTFWDKIQLYIAIFRRIREEMSEA